MITSEFDQSLQELRALTSSGADVEKTLNGAFLSSLQWRENRKNLQDMLSQLRPESKGTMANEKAILSALSTASESRQLQELNSFQILPVPMPSVAEEVDSPYRVQTLDGENMQETYIEGIGTTTSTEDVGFLSTSQVSGLFSSSAEDAQVQEGVCAVQATVVFPDGKVHPNF